MRQLKIKLFVQRRDGWRRILVNGNVAWICLHGLEWVVQVRSVIFDRTFKSIAGAARAIDSEWRAIHRRGK